jgi:putative transposase
MSTPDRRAMLDRNHPELSVRRQCALLSLARSGVYRPVPTEDEADLALMRRIDELFLAHPFLGSRRMAKMLSREGARVNRKRVQRLMRLMGIEALGSRRLGRSRTPRSRRRGTRSIPTCCGVSRSSGPTMSGPPT